MRKLVLVLVIVLSVFVLNGCYCCCPTSTSQTFKPQILGSIEHCEILLEMRDVAPYANYRWPAKEVYQLTSVGDTQIVLDKIGSISNLVESFHAQPGCAELPFGYIKYSNNQEDYVTAVMESGIEFYKISGPNSQLIKMDPDTTITEIVLY
jgi:hypothetical protein